MLALFAALYWWSLEHLATPEACTVVFTCLVLCNLMLLMSNRQRGTIGVPSGTPIQRSGRSLSLPCCCLQFYFPAGRGLLIAVEAAATPIPRTRRPDRPLGDGRPRIAQMAQMADGVVSTSPPRTGRGTPRVAAAPAYFYEGFLPSRVLLISVKRKALCYEHTANS